MPRIRDLLLDEDCNRCEGDLPETKRLPQLPREQTPVADVGDADIVEYGGSNTLDEFKKLLGD